MQSAHLFFSFYESGNEEIMAFDGVTIACVISELKKELIGGANAHTEYINPNKNKSKYSQYFILIDHRAEAPAVIRKCFSPADLSDGNQ